MVTRGSGRARQVRGSGSDLVSGALAFEMHSYTREHSRSQTHVTTLWRELVPELYYYKLVPLLIQW